MSKNFDENFSSNEDLSEHKHFSLTEDDKTSKMGTAKMTRQYDSTFQETGDSWR